MKILRILSTLTMAVLIGTALGAATNINPLAFIGGLFALSLIVPRPSDAMMISLLDLARPTGNNPGAGGGLDSEIILIHKDDIDWDTFPARAADGFTISTNIPLKAGKYMHRFYMTSDVIEPYMKKAKGGNRDSGGWELGVKGFYPGLGDAVLKWVANFGYSFEGIVIIQNCANTKKYLIGEPCNLVFVNDMSLVWGTTVDKEKGINCDFNCKQSAPMAVYTGAISYDPGSASW